MWSTNVYVIQFRNNCILVFRSPKRGISMKRCTHECFKGMWIRDHIFYSYLPFLHPTTMSPSSILILHTCGPFIDKTIFWGNHRSRRKPAALLYYRITTFNFISMRKTCFKVCESTIADVKKFLLLYWMRYQYSQCCH